MVDDKPQYLYFLCTIVYATEIRRHCDATARL